MKTTRWSLLTAMFFMAFADGITAQNPIDSLTQLLSKKIPDSTRAAAESELAYQYDLKSETPSAIKHYELAIDLYLALGDSLSVAKNLRWMAGTYQYANMLDKATIPFLRAIDILEKIGNKEVLAEAHLYFSDFFRVQRDLSNAKEELRKAEKIIKGSNASKELSANIQMMAGLLFIETKEYDSALFRFLKSADLFKQDNFKTRRGLALYNAANMLIEKNMSAKAIPYLDSASTMLNLNDMQMKSSVLRLYCSAHLKLGNHALALDYAQQALKIAEENTLPAEKEVTLEYLSQIYEAKGDFRKALDYHKQYSVMVDSVYDKDKNEQIASLKAQYENDKKEQQLSTQEATIALQQTKTNQLIIGIVSAVVLVIAVLIGFIQKSRSNKVLAKQKSEIEKQNAEREVLLKEIHHRVKNNLQVISSLLSMQSRNMEEGDAKDAVREGQGRIKSMSLIHQKLYSEDNLSKINMKEYLEELSDFLFKSYKPGDDVIRNINAENLFIDVDTAVPLGLIVNELISNALKHAFPATAGGTLNVSLEKTPEEFVLRVSDTGKGLPAGYEQSKSMGMKLVRTLVQQIEGTLHVENTGGTHFLIRFRGLNVA